PKTDQRRGHRYSDFSSAPQRNIDYRDQIVLDYRARSQDLPEEDPERHERRVDALVPAKLEFFHNLGAAILREHIGEGKPSVLEELLPENLDLPPEPSVMSGPHGTASLPVKGVGTPSSEPEGHFSPVLFWKHQLRKV